MATRAHMPTLRVIRILELLAEHPEGLTLTEIASGIDSPKSTILAILRTLRDNKYIFYNAKSAHYVIGIMAFSIGSTYISNMSSLDFIRSEMKYVVRQSGEICQFGVLNGNKVLYVAIEESNTPIRLVSRAGKLLPLYCTAIGKSLICKMDIEEVKALYPNGLEPFTENTITDFDVLAKELDQIRQRGYVAIERGEISLDLTCISVPIFKHDRIVAAVSVSVPAFRATDDKLELARTLLQGMQQKIKNYLEMNNVDPESFLDS